MEQKLNKKRVDMLRNGEGILENDSVKYMLEILKEAENKKWSGNCNYYLKKDNDVIGGYNNLEGSNTKPVHNIAWFYESEPDIVNAPSQLPTSNFGIRVENNNGKEIVQWFKDHGYDEQWYEGLTSDESVYYVREGLKMSCTRMDSITKSLTAIYTLPEITDLELFPEPQGKFLGYVCPMDMFKNPDRTFSVKKGDLFKKYGGVYYLQQNGSNTLKYPLPPEIVELWEKAYEQVPKEIEYMMPFMNGSGVPVDINRFSLFIPGVGHIAITELQNIIDKAKTL